MRVSTVRCRIPHLLAACALAGLTACGGGGGDTPETPTPAVFNAAAALANYLRASNATWTMTGTAASGTAYTMGVSIAAGEAEVFPNTGAAAAVFTTNVTLAAPGVGSVVTQSDSFFDATSGALLGIRTRAGEASSCLKLRAAPATPGTTVSAGASGDLFVADLMTGCTPTATTEGSTMTTRWSVDVIADVSYLCLASSYRDGSNAEVSSETNCVEITTAGVLGARARSTVTSSDLNLTVTTTP